MRFSVIVPLFNKAPYVKKALSSILCQTFTDYELIVVNDGSTDASLAVAKDALAGTGAKIIDQENAGVSVARNNGVAASSGEYICFLDADDWWEPTFLECMNGFIEEYPDAGIWGCGYNIIKNGKSRPAPVGISESFKKGYIDYCSVYAKTLCMPITSISAAIPRTLYDEFWGFKPKLKLGEDFDLWIRIALKYQVAFLNKPLANYNQDVDVATRGTRRLHNPENHMLWNLGYLENEEKTNLDYKQLIDNLRTYALLPYFISQDYHEEAVAQLEKVDWSRQDKKRADLYKKPMWYLRLRDKFMKAGSYVKTMLKKII